MSSASDVDPGGTEAVMAFVDREGALLAGESKTRTGVNACATEEMSSVLAVDLGGTKTAMAFVDREGRAAEKCRVPASRTLDGTVAQLAEYLHGGNAAAAGIIVPGIYDGRTGMAWAPNLWGADSVPLREAAEQRLGIPVAISSDRSGYVLGEQWLGVARGLRDVLFVAVGTGIGVGIISGGRLVEGAHGIAGAAGWMVVGGPWTPCCEKTGGWESQAAGPAVARRAGMDSAETVAAAARAGHAGALEALWQTADCLALGLASLISVLDPEMVVLGGGLMEAGDLMLDRIRANTLRWTQPIAAKQVRIEKSALGGDAGLLGAAWLAWSDGVSDGVTGREQSCQRTNTTSKSAK
jgi:glucokinase